MRPFSICACFISVSFGFAQQTTEKPKFGVASIRASDPDPKNTIFIGMSADGALVKYTNITLRDCIRAAYRVRDFQIIGPEWMTKARFEIQGTLPPGASMDQIPDMLQALLEERFKLEIRREARDHNIYALIAGNGGAKLKPTETKADDQWPKALGTVGKPRPMMMFKREPGGGVSITAPSASIGSLVDRMSGLLPGR